MHPNCTYSQTVTWNLPMNELRLNYICSQITVSGFSVNELHKKRTLQWRGMNFVASQMIVCPTTCSNKHQNSALLTFVNDVHRWLVDSPHKGQVTRKGCPCHDIISGYCVPGEVVRDRHVPVSRWLAHVRLPHRLPYPVHSGSDRDEPLAQRLDNRCPNK